MQTSKNQLEYSISSTAEYSISISKNQKPTTPFPFPALPSRVHPKTNTAESSTAEMTSKNYSISVNAKPFPALHFHSHLDMIKKWFSKNGSQTESRKRGLTKNLIELTSLSQKSQCIFHHIGFTLKLNWKITFSC